MDLAASNSAIAEQRPLGALLVGAGLVSADDVARALTFQRQFGGRIGSILVRMGAVGEDRLLQILSQQLGWPVVARDALPTVESIRATLDASSVEFDWWLDQSAFAWTGEPGSGGGVVVVARDPLAALLQETAQRCFGTVTFALVATQDLDRLLDALRRADEFDRVTPETAIEQLRELAEAAPSVELVANMLSQAAAERASDIHVEPGERSFTVRLRLDGVLQKRLDLPRDRFDAVASRIKLMAGCDIAERRLPQDGRFVFRAGGGEIDVRVSALPGVHGESLVLRLLPKGRMEFSLDRLGMEAATLARYRAAIAGADGIVLVTGPTGSGKSTTLYATIESIDAGEDKIVTVEDPVEYELPGISQVQVQSDIGYDFARALRAILRQDPDVIMIGEIRDRETAEIAAQAALTGHLVFSTLHTNHAIGAITRLIDLGVEPFLVATALRMVAAQRLVRRLCPHCATRDEPGAAIDAEARALGLAGTANWLRPVGCSHCGNTGYRGRLGLYEAVPIDASLHDAIVAGAQESELVRRARAAGYAGLREDGLAKAWRGETSVAEILRVLGGGELDA
ncbi:GspE/PulE family protein [Roseiterribacter gracilis]